MIPTFGKPDKEEKELTWISKATVLSFLVAGRNIVIILGVSQARYCFSAPPPAAALSPAVTYDNVHAKNSDPDYLETHYTSGAETSTPNGHTEGEE